MLKYNKIATIFLAIIILCNSFAYSQEIKKLTILHWNDQHSFNLPQKTSRNADSLGGYANLSAYINKYRNENKNVLVLNAGDNFQGTPISIVTKGASQIDILNLINPDAVILGNHEFDYSADVLFKTLKKAKFDIIAANLYEKKSKKLIYKPYKIMILDSMKIAIIGLSVPDLGLYLPENIKKVYFENIFTATRRNIEEVKQKEKPNLIILLSHAGIEDDKKLADSFPDIHVIIGGHSHTLLKKSLKVKNTIICQAGSMGLNLGKLDIEFSLKENTILSFHGEVVPVKLNVIPADPKVQKKVMELETLVSQKMKETIGTLETDWIRSSRGESNVGNWLADVVRKYTNADIAFQNNGSIRKNLLAGKITIRDVWEVSPFGNTFVSFYLRGDSVLKLFEHQCSEVNEMLQVSGIKLVFDPKKPAGKRIVSFKINDQDIDVNKQYLLGTSNYVATQGLKYFGFEINQAKIKDTGYCDRDMFVEVIKKQKKVSSKIEGRIIRLKE